MSDKDDMKNWSREKLARNGWFFPHYKKTGTESIRIGGQEIGSLPIAEAALAKPQLIIAKRTEKENKIANIRAKYPTQNIDYLKSRVFECQENIKRIQAFKQEQLDSIQQYTGLISQCEIRDREIAKTNDKARLKEIRGEFPLYQVDAMKIQIKQYQEAVTKSDEVIAQEYASISELENVLTLCKQRDKELKNIE